MSLPRFVQAQAFVISSAGASAGDTTLIIQSFKLIDGTTNIVTANLGDQCYGTLEPNNGTQEEAIQFTGVTQNANGTATLTGVSSVGFVFPYTVSSGLAKSHAGGVTFILSNDAALYGNISNYINTVVASGAALASDTTAGLTKLSVTPTTGSNPIAVGDNDSRVPTQTERNYLSGIVPTAVPYSVATGTANAFTATVASAISSLASGTSLHFLVPVTNATGLSLNINSLGAKNVKKNVNSTLASGDLLAGQVADVVYDGTNFQLISPASSTLSLFNSGTNSHDISSATADTIAHGLGVIPKIVRANFAFTNTTCINFASSTYINGVQKSVNVAGDVGTTTGNVAGNAVNMFTSISGTYASAAITIDATNITITWSKNGSPTGTAYYNWEAVA